MAALTTTALTLTGLTMARASTPHAASPDAAPRIDSAPLTSARQRQCLADAYPAHFLGIRGDNQLVSRDGNVYDFDTGVRYRDFDDELDRADLASQLRQRYPAGPQASAPGVNEDPGRLRHTPLFSDMYGASPKAVASKSVGVNWKPCNCRVPFSSVNGAAAALQRVGDALAADATLSRLAARPLGTVAWRTIAGTKRPSMHAFAIAIDFALPDNLGRYWRWDAGGKPRPILPLAADHPLQLMVQVFERHGFIWGGKWHHYDGMHFEFRPELAGGAGCAG